MTEQHISIEDLRIRLTPGQQKAAELIVERDFNARVGQKKTTYGDIAAEVGITDRQLYTWRKDPNFTRYTAAISDNRLDQYRSLADSQLLKLVQGTSNNGLPSIKGLEMYYKLIGRMKDQPIVSISENKQPTMTREEAREELQKLNKFIN